MITNIKIQKEYLSLDKKLMRVEGKTTETKEKTDKHVKEQI